MEKGAGVKLVDVGVALSTVQVVQVQPCGYGGQTQPHKVDEQQLRIIGILQQFAQFRADAEVRMQKMEAQFKEMKSMHSALQMQVGSVAQQQLIDKQQRKARDLEAEQARGRLRERVRELQREQEQEREQKRERPCPTCRCMVRAHDGGCYRCDQERSTKQQKQQQEQKEQERKQEQKKQLHMEQQMRTIIQQQKAIETQQQKQAALEPTLKLVAFRSLQIQNQINQQQQTINQQQKWMDKHEEEQQQPGLWHVEAESDGAYCDESAIDIDRLVASMEQDGA